jgi:hypothetical protein
MADERARQDRVSAQRDQIPQFVGGAAFSRGVLAVVVFIGC